MSRPDANFSKSPRLTRDAVAPPKLGCIGRLIGFGLLLVVALAAIWLTDLHLHSVRAATDRTGQSTATGGH